MRDVFITAGNVVTGAGDLGSTWSSLMAGRTALTPKQLDMVSCSFPLGVISDLKAPFGTTKRLNELLHNLFQGLPQLDEKTPLICATTKGAIDEIFNDPEKNSTQIQQIGRWIGDQLNLTGEISTVSGACASGTIAIIEGAMRIAQGQDDHVLIVAVDLLSNFVVGGFASLKGLSPHPCKPFDKNRDGLSLGEGAGWLLLSNKKEQHNDNLSPCQLSSWSLSCDATHITAPCREGSGLIRALDAIVSEKHQPVGAVNAHGTGTVYNDAMELRAFGHSLNDGTPVCSIKGCIGHCLGGAGLIETAISIKSLEKHVIPPTVGLHETDKTNMHLSGTSSLPLLHPTILSCNSGFGGINAAVLLSQI